MGDSQQDQSRQRAREAAFAAHDRSHGADRLVDAIEAYFDERMRGEPSEYQRGASDQETALRTVIHDALDRVGAPSRDESGAHLGEGNRIAAFGREMTAAHARITELETALDQAVNGNAALYRRIFELEAVVRAADAMRERMTCATTYSKGWPQDRCDCGGCEMMRTWDAARAKLDVPHG
jgi:hypothetical protein